MRDVGTPFFVGGREHAKFPPISPMMNYWPVDFCAVTKAAVSTRSRLKTINTVPSQQKSGRNRAANRGCRSRSGAGTDVGMTGKISCQEVGTAKSALASRSSGHMFTWKPKCAKTGGPRSHGPTSAGNSGANRKSVGDACRVAKECRRGGRQGRLVHFGVHRWPGFPDILPGIEGRGSERRVDVWAAEVSEGSCCPDSVLFCSRINRVYRILIIERRWMWPR